MDYKQQLLDPRWQKKRLEVLQRDNFTCKICGNKQSTLHVHRLFYDKELKCWEYPNNSYITLCEECHSNEHKSNKILQDRISQLKKKGFTNIELSFLLDCICCAYEETDNDFLLIDILGMASDKKIPIVNPKYVSDICRNLAYFRNNLKLPF